jgi:hypothetical protein
MKRDELVTHLQIETTKDTSKNGLQLERAKDVARLALAEHLSTCFRQETVSLHLPTGA